MSSYSVSGCIIVFISMLRFLLYRLPTLKPRTTINSYLYRYFFRARIEPSIEGNSESHCSHLIVPFIVKHESQYMSVK